MFVGSMIHVYLIKFPFHLVIGAPILILTIYGNINLLFIYYPVFNIVNSLIINLVGFPSFIFGAVMGYVTSYSLNFCKDRMFPLIYTNELLMQEF